MKQFLTVFVLFILSLTSFAAQKTTLEMQLAKLEAGSEGHLGIAAINTANNQTVLYRADERFPMASTVKLLIVANVLHNSMHDPKLLQEQIHYTKSDLSEWSPITEKHVSDGMSIEALCAAAISYSDSTAMHLLVKKLGGAEKINAFARSIGDKQYQLSAETDTEVSTTTPQAMQNTLQKLALADTLGAKEQALLVKWLKENTTGDLRIRAGVPKGWVVGDKTGSGSTHGTTNDIAVIWPPKRPPIIIAIYYTSDKKSAQKRTDLLASATRMILTGWNKI